MKKNSSIFIIFLLSFLVSCDKLTNIKGVLKEVSLEKSMDICKSNGGLKQIHTRYENYHVVCENGAVISQKSKENEVNQSHPFVTQDELKFCGELCSKNTGLKQIEVERICSNLSRYRCEEYSDVVKCGCNNNIELSRTITRKQSKDHFSYDD